LGLPHDGGIGGIGVALGCVVSGAVEVAVEPCVQLTAGGIFARTD